MTPERRAAAGEWRGSMAFLRESDRRLKMSL